VEIATPNRPVFAQRAAMANVIAHSPLTVVIAAE
jgi:hypothetical protein